MIEVLDIENVNTGVLREDDMADRVAREDNARLSINVKYHTYIEKLEKISVGDWIDLRAAEDVVMRPHDYKLISLGVSMKLPEGYEAIVAPRSSTFKKYGIIQANGIGIIDNSYSGDNDIWKFPAYCLETREIIDGRRCSKIKKGDRICQFRIQKVQPSINFVEVETLGGSDRGGFGSTGVR